MVHIRPALLALGLTALAALAVASVDASHGPDAVVNDPSLDDGIQSETTLAVRGSTICGGYNDFVGSLNGSGFSRSPDLGTTWVDRGAAGGFADGVLAVHQATGRFYEATLAFLGGLSAVGVARSTDDCDTFPSMANASPTTSNAADFQDKPWIAVDSTGGARDGYVYVCWTRLINHDPIFGGADIRFSRSVDGGVTFVDEQVISPDTDVFPFGCHVDVGPNGEVYVTWSNGSFGTGDFSIRFLRSLDGGLSWLGPVHVNSATVRPPGLDRIVGSPPCDSLRLTLNGDIRMLHQTWMGVDRTGGSFNGRIYVVWAHDPPGAVDNSDVYVSSSADGGVTWTPQFRLGGGTLTDQFEPFVEVGGQGTVAIAWYDRRNDPGANFDIDVYTTFTRNGGASFDPLVRVTDVSFPPYVSNCYMGEYIAVASDATNFYYAWGDNRSPDPDVFFDRIPVPLLKDPDADIDGDTVPNSIDTDDDADGCTDARELLANPSQGGLRDRNHFWDFYDTPNSANVRDKAVTVTGDVLRVAQRFGANDASGTATPNRNSDPLAGPIPAAPGYHPGFDRGPINGPNTWNMSAADGTISVVVDVLGVARQFGHSCL